MACDRFSLAPKLTSKGCIFSGRVFIDRQCQVDPSDYTHTLREKITLGIKELPGQSVREYSTYTFINASRKVSKPDLADMASIVTPPLVCKRSGAAIAAQASGMFW